MNPSSSAMDRVRRAVDDVTVLVSLTILAWPLVLDGAGRGAPGWIPPAGLIVVSGAVFSRLGGRWPATLYVPVVAALAMASMQRAPGTDSEFWLLLAMTVSLLTRQVLGVHTLRGLIRDPAWERAIRAGETYRDPLTATGTMYPDHAGSVEAERRRTDEKELRRALAENQFEVHYQPIVDLAGEHTVGVEALVRWRHPERGLLAPGAFLELAESLGLVRELGRWVLERACEQAVRWQRDDPAFELNVNLSASQLSDEDLTDAVRDVLERTGFPPGQLVLELTETVALTDLAESARVLGSLKTLGVRIALDDFGTGFSSLTHLGVLPVDVVKIDRSFVQAMPECPSAASVAQAVLQIARTFGLAPVAEGVEDASQASRLRELDCGQAQGYHFARPMPAEAITELLARQGAVL